MEMYNPMKDNGARVQVSVQVLVDYECIVFLNSTATCDWQ